MTTGLEVPLLGSPYQLAYVAADLDAAIEAFARIGASSFVRLDAVKLVSDDGGASRISMALGWIGTTMFELIEPADRADPAFIDALPAAPRVANLHHLCFRVETPRELQAIHDACRGMGMPIMFRGTTPSGSRFLYADLRASLGHVVEYLFLAPTSVTFHDGLPTNAGLPQRPLGPGRPTD